MLAVLAIVLSYHVATIEIVGSRGGFRRTAVAVRPGLIVRDVNDRRFKVWLRDASAHWRGSRLTLFMEQMLPPVVGRDGWRYLPDLNIYQQIGGTLAVSQRITDGRLLQAIHAQGYQILAWRAHEWEFLLPATIDAHSLVEFVDDPGDLFGLPVRGRPFD
jgi:hypothetical protein